MMITKNLLLMVLAAILIIGCREDKKQPNTSSDTIEEDVSQSTGTIERNVQIIPIEHATAVIEWGETTIYIDPTGGAAAFEGQKKPDIILVTDIHGDHFNLETLEALDTSSATFVVPQAVADDMPEQYAQQLEILNNGKSGRKAKRFPRNWFDD